MTDILNGFILLSDMDDWNAEVAITPHVSLWFLLRRQTGISRHEAGARWDGSSDAARIVRMHDVGLVVLGLDVATLGSAISGSF